MTDLHLEMSNLDASKLEYLKPFCIRMHTWLNSEVKSAAFNIG